MRSILGLAILLLPMALRAETLSEIYRLALANDPVYAAAQAAYKASLERLPQARASLLPNLNLNAFARNTDTDLGTSSTSTQPYGFGLTLRQPIYNKTSLETLALARLQVTLAEQQLALARQDLMLRTAQAYFDVLLAQDNLAAALAQKQAFAEQLAQARKSFEVGAATIVDSHEAQARYDQAVAQEIAARNDLEVKQRALERLIHRGAPRLAPLREPVRLPSPEPADIDPWLRQAQEQALAVQLKQTTLEIARREVDRQRGGHHPTLDLAASFSDTRRTSVTPGGGAVNSKTGSVGVELNLPLYQGGGVSARVREAIFGQERALSELEAARRDAALAARQAFLGVVSGIARSRALEQALTSVEAQLKSTRLGLEVGVRTRVDVLNAERERHNTLRDLYAARYQVLLDLLRLEAAAGSLDEEDLRAVDALLSPAW